MTPLVIDWETIELLPDGASIASTEAYRANFRVLSMAACERMPDGSVKSAYLVGEDACRDYLHSIAPGRPLIAHNIQYEILVATCRFADVQLNWAIDTMRLAQNYDNGGDDDSVEYVYDEDGLLDEDGHPKVKRKPTQGLGLVACSKRILGKSGSHKEEAHRWIRVNIRDSSGKPVKKGKEGAYLNHLPADVLERYNIADVEVTLELYEHCITHFAAIGFDWRQDHDLFLGTVAHLVLAKIRGAPVDRHTLDANCHTVRQEILAIEEGFAARFSSEIAALEHARTLAYIAGPKTEKGKEGRAKKIREGHEKACALVRFNTGSNKQLATLFMGQLGLVPKFFTAKGAPSFKSAMLGQWGEAGEMLKKRRKRLIVLTQMESLLAASEYDGKWHASLRACGTKTNRFAGGN